ncbi:helix-turn-helix domain-containing protein [Rhodobaculum claviforme]|uniref:XRE family transcriptional regulator n=1 Tax=Rhodobaculum claviforme TaxID=1549854 RepID=A0A934WHN2_9RHOB|nr:helix-turn-helix transcriptional regulator [Rhodobaculum claviforme]MBK5926011.1 XRE family transcriptional regulator [Rhodobaculum claviforme]
MQKTFIGPRLRRLRTERGETQAQLARALGVSASYVNLLENNQRSVSVPILLRLMEVTGIDWRDIAEDDEATHLADLRAALADPLFAVDRPDLAQLRAALVHSPGLVAAFVKLHHSYRAATEQLLTLGAAGDAPASPEGVIHDLFRRNRNHFRDLEDAALRFWPAPVPPDEVYGALKSRLRAAGIRVRLVSVAEMPHSLRRLDEAAGEVLLSEALDHPNRVFQLLHVAGLLDQRGRIDALLDRSGIPPGHDRARCRVELANYFAAAVLMPYDPFLAEARASKYDFDHLATRFGVSFEQACHRATTLQREGAQGVPFFFLRIDRAGNVTKRFNATEFQLAEYGGACPRLELHMAFRIPGRIVPQFVEMPDASQYFVFSRTVDRPSFGRQAQDHRLSVAMGCAIRHAGDIGYAEAFRLSGAGATGIGINCRVCPRPNCDQRAHQAVVLTRPLDERHRGATRFES